MDNRVGYNPRGAYVPNGPRGVSMYPIQSLAPLVDVPYGGGPGLSARYSNIPSITSTRVCYR
jgi:hypothetical protein